MQKRITQIRRNVIRYEIKRNVLILKYKLASMYLEAACIKRENSLVIGRTLASRGRLVRAAVRVENDMKDWVIQCERVKCQPCTQGGGKAYHCLHTVDMGEGLLANSFTSVNRKIPHFNFES